MPAKPAAWQTEAIKLFNELPVRVFSRRELAGLLGKYQSAVGVPRSTSLNRFIEVLRTQGALVKVDIPPLSAARPAETSEEEARPYRTVTRYIWRDATAFEVALSLRAGSYLSHASAVFLLGLTTQIPRAVYVNKEQGAKSKTSGQLTQGGIDRAFRSKHRMSNFLFSFHDTRIVLLSGMQTGNLEVSDIADASGRPYPATKLERTLIDITVRPNYAGGVFDVLDAFRGARARASVPTLVATLRKLGYTYPYHQAIGFYLQRAGYPDSALERLRAFGLHYDFYLAYNVSDAVFDPVWRVYHPQGL